MTTMGARCWLSSRKCTMLDDIYLFSQLLKSSYGCLLWKGLRNERGLWENENNCPLFWPTTMRGQTNGSMRQWARRKKQADRRQADLPFWRWENIPYFPPPSLIQNRPFSLASIGPSSSSSHEWAITEETTGDGPLLQGNKGLRTREDPRGEVTPYIE